LRSELLPDVLDIALQEVSDLLNGRTESNTVSEFREIDRRPGAWLVSVHWATPGGPLEMA
jgi:hypothetical protein